MKKFKLSLLFILFSQVCSSVALADAPDYGFSESEAIQLPPFCLGLSIANFQDSAKHLARGVKVPGQHTQHFCHGMKSILRGNYPQAIGEFDYVQEHSTAQHELLDSTSLYKAEALGKLGKAGPAIQEYNKAIQLNNKYHQAYAKLADFYVSRGLKQEALDTINAGLKYSPNSKGLKHRLAKLTAQK